MSLQSPGFYCAALQTVKTPISSGDAFHAEFLNTGKSMGRCGDDSVEKSSGSALVMMSR